MALIRRGTSGLYVALGNRIEKAASDHPKAILRQGDALAKPLESKQHFVFIFYFKKENHKVQSDLLF